MLEKVSDEELHDVNLCVISPGFPKNNSVYLKVKKKKIPVISELELGYLYGKGELCAITGSNGKTTTVELTGNIMRKKYGENVNVVGNVGTPYCEKVFANEDKEIEYVVECSSFQLEDIVKFRPKVATILNFSPDHLDRYDSYTDYINAKLNIAINMNDKDVLVLNYEDHILRDLALQKIF